MAARIQNKAETKPKRKQGNPAWVPGGASGKVVFCPERAEEFIKFREQILK